eukprot:1153481-Pelagomonas_calceolata.AAC.9
MQPGLGTFPAAPAAAQVCDCGHDEHAGLGVCVPALHHRALAHAAPRQRSHDGCCQRRPHGQHGAAGHGSRRGGQHG